MKKFTYKSIVIWILCAVMLCMSVCIAVQKKSGEPQGIQATVMEVEKFGHVVLDLTADDFAAAGYDLGDIVRVRFDAFESDMPYFDGYYTNPGAFMLRGLSPESNLAVCINYGHFSEETGVIPGDMAEIMLVEKGGMLAIQELCSLQYSNNPEDYSSNAVFANFREITAGRIGGHKLYRTASPISNERGRAGYADDLIEAAGVATILNLADSGADIDAFCEAEDFASQYYRDRYESGKVMALDLAGDFFSESFAASLAEGFAFLAQNEPPYCIHCTEGKDRAGFAAMLLEALMGAELPEIIDDYMLTYCNYYGIDAEGEPERYQAVLDLNLIPILLHVTGAQTRQELEQLDLEAAVTEFLLGAGMAEADMVTLKEKLR